MTERIPRQSCLECGKRIDAIGDLSDDPNGPGPTPGDPIACIGCGAVMTMGEDGRVRGFTDKEMDELIASEATMNELAKLISKIHFLRTAN